MGREQWDQREKAIDAALALCQLFYINGDVLGKVDAFRYLGHIMAQDDDNICAVRSQIKKARGIWARQGKPNLACGKRPAQGKC